MADTGKTKITVKKIINPFGETKTKKMPLWIDLRPSVLKDLAPVFIQRQIQVDLRRIKQKDIENGIYAVARYELALFATQLNGIDKSIKKAVDANKPYKGKLPKDKKGETPALTAELDKAQKDIVRLYKAIAKKIEDKVAIALDDLESDKGDNKKGLALGKEALKRFDPATTKKMFAGPRSTVEGGFSSLISGLNTAKTDKDRDAAFKSALTAMKKAESEFESVGGKVEKVIRFLLSAGEKMTKDKKSAPALQAFGEKLSDGKLKKKLGELGDMISDFGHDLDECVRFAAEATADLSDAKTEKTKFLSNQKGSDRAASDAISEIDKLGKEFKELTKNLK